MTGSGLSPKPPERPRGIDLELLARHTTWGRWCLGQILAAFAIGVMMHPSIAPHLALASRAPIVMLAMWPLAYGILNIFGARLFVEARLLPLRVALIWFAAATMGAVGACSRLDVSPGYGLLLVIPPCWGHLFTANRHLTAALALSPVLLRLGTVPDPSRNSIWAALGIGAIVALSFELFSWRRIQRRRREAQQLMAEARGAGTVEQAADRLTAMRLHDRLSGVLMLAEARGDDNPQIARLVVEQARIALGGWKRAPVHGAECARELTALARSLGLSAEVTMAGPDPRSVAWGELYELLVELVANHARHGRERALSIALSLRRGSVQARVPAPAGAAGGRGRRNLVSRIDALDGTLRFRGSEAHISLPAVDVAPPRFVVLWIMEFLTHVAVLLVLARGGITVVASFGALSAVLAVINVFDMRLDRQQHAARVSALRAQIGAAAPIAIERTRSTLEPLVARIEHAAEGAPDERRHAISGLAQRLGEVLGTLEASEPRLSERVDPAARA